MICKHSARWRVRSSYNTPACHAPIMYIISLFTIARLPTRLTLSEQIRHLSMLNRKQYTEGKFQLHTQTTIRIRKGRHSRFNILSLHLWLQRHGVREAYCRLHRWAVSVLSVSHYKYIGQTALCTPDITIDLFGTSETIGVF